MTVGTQLAGLVLAVVNATLITNLLTQAVKFHTDRTRGTTLSQEVFKILEHAATVFVLQAILTQVFAQLNDKVHIGFNFAYINGLVNSTVEDRRSAVMGHHNVILLGARGQRQEQVASCFNSRRDEHVGSHAELKVLQAFVPTMRLSAAGRSQKRGGLNPTHANLVRLALGHSVEHHVGLSVTDVVNVQRILFVANSLVAQVFGQTIPTNTAGRACCIFSRVIVCASVGLVQVELGLLAFRCKLVLNTGSRINLGNNLTTGNIDVARNGHQSQNAVCSLVAVLVLVECQTPSNRSRLCVCVHASSLVDILYGNFADLSSLFGGHTHLGVIDAGCKLVEAIAPVLNELMIVKILVDDNPQPSHSHCRVGTRTNTQMNFSARRKPVDARINGNQLSATFHQVDNSMTEQAVTVGGKRHLTPHNHDLGHMVCRIVERAFQTACIVHFRIIRTKHVRTGHGTRLIASIAGLGVACIRRAQNSLSHIGNKNAARTTRAREHCHAFRTICIAEIVTFLFHNGKSLIPRDTLPLVGHAAELRVALHGVDNAARVVDIILQSQATCAQTTLGNGVVLVALDMIDYALFVDVNLQAASNRMAARRRPHRSTNNGKVALLVLPRLAKIILELHAFPFSLFLARACHLPAGVLNIYVFTEKIFGKNQANQPAALLNPMKLAAEAVRQMDAQEAHCRNANANRECGNKAARHIENTRNRHRA